jgi:hypothetical protein
MARPDPTPAAAHHRLWLVLVPLLLTAAVYRPVGRFDFVDLDDPYYVSNNPALTASHGTADVLRYACTTFTGGNYHPLVWLSYLFDRWAWHLSPGPMHVENGALHAVSGGLVLLLLADATGRWGRAAVCAALFAVHPMHVESVAWVSERKDCLSTVWLLATACCYVRFARTDHRRWYAAMVACYALSLSAKSMGVTLPFLLLLLDAWPLDRLRGAVRSRVVEKLPLLAMAAAAAAVAVVAQWSVGATAAMSTTPVDRLGNAAVSTVRYLGDLFWPTGLAAFYPYQPVPPTAAVVSLALLIAVTLVAVRLRTRRPYLLVGWLWFLGTLLPVSGVVQIGMQAMADRYTYFPSIGLSVAVVWLLADVASGIRWLAPVLATTAVACLTVAGARQVEFWRDSRTLFAHAVEVTDDNYLALNGLGRDAMRRGDLPAAARYLNAALDARRDFAPAYANLGRCLLLTGHPTEAADAYRNAVRLAPADPALRAALADAERSEHRSN